MFKKFFKIVSVVIFSSVLVLCSVNNVSKIDVVRSEASIKIKAYL